MRNKQQVIDAWKLLGWESVQDYCNFLSNGTCKREMFEDKFHPSNVNIKDFWKATDEVFSTDTVANCTFTDSKPYSITEANLKNHRIPLYLGLLGGMSFAEFNSKHKFNRVAIAEIGCGYGSFKENYIRDQKYTGFDIIPRSPDVIELSDDGCFTQQQVEMYKEEFTIFYSCNVFQHLSKQQIVKYLEQVHEMLPIGGYFVFSYVKQPQCGYTFHYGQMIDIVATDLFKDIIKQNGYHIWYEFCMNNVWPGLLDPIGFVLEKF